MCSFHLKPVFLMWICCVFFFSLSFCWFYGSSSFQFQKSTVTQSCVCTHVCAPCFSICHSSYSLSGPLHWKRVQKEYLLFMNGADPGLGPRSEKDFKLHLPPIKGLKNPTDSIRQYILLGLSPTQPTSTFPVVPWHGSPRKSDTPLSSEFSPAQSPLSH